MIDRNSLTKIFLQQWGKSIDDANVELYNRKWWQSNRVNKPNAFRLSDEGYEFLTVTLEEPISNLLPLLETIAITPFAALEP